MLHLKQKSTKKQLAIFSFCLFLILLTGCIKQKQVAIHNNQKSEPVNKNEDKKNNTNMAENKDATDNTETNIEKDSLGKTTISFAYDRGLVYIKSETTLTDPIVESINGERTITRIYTSDEDYTEPHELICLNPSDYKWTVLVTEPIDNSAGDKSISVSDHLFSFKKIPNTDNFLFVVEWWRHGGESGELTKNERVHERVLYVYDKDNAGHELKSIITYNDKSLGYTYPRIDSFSPEKRYVSLNLFGCWECDGHQPEKLLLDTKSFTTKNIGRVSQFSWTSNGNYEYKDYVVIGCENPQQPWVCTQNPDALPLKTGKM